MASASDKLKAWCSNNAETSPTPGSSIRNLTFTISPETPGGNANISNGKMTGTLTLANVSDDFAAKYGKGREVDLDVLLRDATPAPSV